ncbi:MAG: orotidine-5'-phosphate decarboxylase [Oscillospiraceae bacterium]|jgi:orotidine-5'-phosphate decarboxylase|nr:orotidine-5'-phosphate decarboxylase [Oscillospiraceae bacterium]
MTQHLPTRDVIIACDFPTGDATLAFLARFGAARPFVKIGMELFYGEGPEIVRALKSRGHAVFLDLKLHDIPTTVRRAMANLRSLGVDMTNVHAAGGKAMMAAAREGLGEGARLIAVTQLTSTSPETLREELLIVTPMEETVRHYAQNARSAGLDGVVCSPLEAAGVHAACGADFLTVTPGIRYPEGSADDQARATTPAKARALGSDFIVVGRPITAAADPLAAYERTRRDFL